MDREIGVIFVLIFCLTAVFAFNESNNKNITLLNDSLVIRDFDSMEILNRGQDYNIYIGDNGDRIARVSPEPINYLASLDSYLPINTTIVNSCCEFDWCVRKGVYWADFMENSYEKGMVRFLFNGSYITYSPLPLRFVSKEDSEIISGVNSVVGEVKDNEFVYENIYGEGLSIGYEYKNSFLKENLVINSLRDLSEPNIKNAVLSLEFVFESKVFDKVGNRIMGNKDAAGNREIGVNDKLKDIEIFLTGEVLQKASLTSKILGKNEKRVSEKNLKWDKAENLNVKGEAWFGKGDGGFAFRMPTPYAVDSNGVMLELEYVFEDRDGEMVVSVLTPYNWLADEERVFPVKIDPSVSGEEEDNVRMIWKFSGGTYGGTTSPGSYVAAGTNSAFTKYRSYFSWDFSNSLRNKLGEANVDDAHVALGVDSNAGIYPILYIDDDSDYTASRSWENWFNYIDGGNYPDSYNTGSSNLFSVSDSQIEGMSTSSKDFFVHLTGYESGAYGIVYVDNAAWLSFDYDCDINSGCNDYCLLNNGVDCDCYGECLSGRCYGSSSGNYKCQSFGCADDGEYAPQFASCCSGLSWDYVTGKCFGVTCGDGVIEGLEECDDYNTKNGDGCSSSCSIESGYSCSGTPSTCIVNCGDGLIRGDEECDDKNTSPNDGCDSSCDVESGWSCSGEPSSCSEEVEYCSGEINVYVEDSSGNELEGVYAYLNGGNGYDTNSDGFQGFYIVNKDCDDSHLVQVKCSDENTICGSDSTRINDKGGYDIDSMYFVCDVCSGEKDILIDEDSVLFRESGGDTNLSFIVKSVGINDDFSAELTCGELSKKDISISAGESKLVSFIGDLSECRKVDIILSGVSLEDKDITNNRIDDLFVIDVLKVRLFIDSGYSLVDEEIRNFIGDYVEIVTSAGDDVLDVHVGRKLAPDYNGEWGVKDGLVRYNGLSEGVPYVGMLVKEGNKVYAFGNELDGTIAAVRRLVDGREEYLNERRLNEDRMVYVGEEDVGAISVYDYLHTDENDEFYRKNNAEFANVVDNVLRRQTFNIAIKRVLTANEDEEDRVVLRLKNVNHELSPAFKNFSNDRPVVLGHGLFGNLFSMEDLGMKIATDEANSEDYRDTWLIEYTGGPNTDCPTCPNYDMDDLTEYYWPALIGGVLAYTGESSVDYVGYSAGGGVGARSYEAHFEGLDDAGWYVNEDGEWEGFSLPADFVDHMALIAPMGAFNGTTPFTRCIDAYGDDILKGISDYDHIYREMVVKKIGIASAIDSLLAIGMPEAEAKESCTLAFIALALSKENQISYNFWEDITELVINKTDKNPTVNVNELLSIRGRFGGPGDDGVIPDSDIEYIYDNSVANEKYHSGIMWFHADMPNEDVVYDPLLTKFLNDEFYSVWDKIRYVDEFYISL